MYDFLSSCIAPLRLRLKPPWLDTYHMDAVQTMRSRGNELPEGMLWGAFRLLLGCDMPQLMAFPVKE